MIAQYKPIFLILILTLSIFAAIIAVWAFMTEAILIAALAVLSSIYMLIKFFSIQKENLKMLEEGFQFRGKIFKFSEIEAIHVLDQNSAVTPNLKLYLLGNSAIYTIQMKKQTIQVIGKLYKNVDAFMVALADKANISVQEMKG